MVGSKLYERRRRVYLFLLVYGGLLIAGIIIAMQAVSRQENVPYTSGFLLIFGGGMFVMTLIKSRSPQVTVYEDYITLRQSRVAQIIRYRNILSISRPDANRIVITLLEDGSRKEVPVYIKELEGAEIEKLAEYLKQKSLKKD